jgi:hypothetical protein
MSKGVKEIIRKDREELARKLKIECRPCGDAVPLPAIGETPAIAGAALNASAPPWTPSTSTLPDPDPSGVSLDGLGESYFAPRFGFVAMPALFAPPTDAEDPFDEEARLYAERDDAVAPLLVDGGVPDPAASGTARADAGDTAIVAPPPTDESADDRARRMAAAGTATTITRPSPTPTLTPTAVSRLITLVSRTPR